MLGQLFLNHFKQDQELEADRVGLRYADSGSVLRVRARILNLPGRTLRWVKSIVLRRNCATCCAMNRGIRTPNADSEKSSNACHGGITRGLPAVLAYGVVPFVPVLQRRYSSMPRAGLISPIGPIGLGDALPVG